MHLWNPYSEELRQLVLKSEGHSSIESFIRAVGGDQDYVMPEEPCGYHGLGYDPNTVKLSKSPTPFASSDTPGNNGESRLRSSAKFRRLLSVEQKNHGKKPFQRDVHTQAQVAVVHSTENACVSDSDNEDTNLRWRKHREYSTK